MSAVTLAVLAGGRGERMGQPKGTLMVGNAPILPYLLNRLAWPGPTLLVTAPGRERPPGWDRFGAEAVDPVADQGPLRGVLTAMEVSTTPLTVVVTVDMPGLTHEHLAWVVAELGPAESGWMMQRDGQVEPFPLVLRASAVMDVRARVASGRRSVHGLATEPRFYTRPAPADWPAAAWANLNTPADLAGFDPG